MQHVGIDLGATYSHLVVISETGELVQRTKVATSALPRWLGKRGPSRVVMEACTQSPAIARAALEAEHQVFVIPGTLVRALGVGARGIKTDERDAETLARASLRNEDLPTVHLRSEPSRSHRELLMARATLRDARKAVANSVKTWLRGRLIRIRGRASSLAFCDAVRKVALESSDGLPNAIEALLQSFASLTQQIEALEQELTAIAEQDERCQRLMEIPGVGPLVSLSFVTHVDDPKRFASASQLSSYLALVPGEATTGGKVVRTSTLRAGPRWLKALLVQAAWSMWRSRPNEPMVVWARAIADKRGKRIAIVALARKLATVMWAMWRHETQYAPNRATTAPLP